MSLKTKKISSLLVLLTCVYVGFAQDSYKKRYYISEMPDSEILSKEKKSYGKLNLKSVLFKKETRPKVKTKENDVFIQTDTLIKNIQFEEIGILKTPNTWSKIFRPNIGRLKSNVKFVGNKIHINPWLSKTDTEDYTNRNDFYYFELKNRQAVKLTFRQWSFNALSVPLKIRFGKEDVQFSTGANLGALFGYTWGVTKFVYREKIDNDVSDSKFTTGIFLGTDNLEFTYLNEKNEEQVIDTALVSIGIGLLYSYQKFTFGVTIGTDLGLGENVDQWEYNDRPWIGLSLGYSLFSF